jgi:2,5-diketo-D-gluconate reductase B
MATVFQAAASHLHENDIRRRQPGSMGQSVDESLRKLRSDHVDLLLLHWPNSAVPLEDQIGALNDIVRAGKASHIGVSNYNRELLARATALCLV